MKAFLLAAGIGSRLRPLTDTMPKCMLPINDKPLLACWLELLGKHDVTEVLLNTHHHRERVESYVDTHNKEGKQPQITAFFEQALLGSGGTVKVNKDFVETEESFLICYADILTNADLTSLIQFHNTHNGVLTMALAHTNTPHQAGIATVDVNGIITEFIEKPANPQSALANGGIYVARQSLFDFFPNRGFIDFASDVLQYLPGKMYGYAVKCFHQDIGTLDNYYRVQDEWASIYYKKPPEMESI